jgi:hypothetical protein
LRCNKDHQQGKVLDISHEWEMRCFRERAMTFSFEDRTPIRADIALGILTKAIRRWRARREVAGFVRNNPIEASRVARDLNLDIASLLKIAARDGAPRLLDRRLALRQMTLKVLRHTHPAVAQDLERCGALCERKARCARDLDRNAGCADSTDYCPNEHTISALLRTRKLDPDTIN